MRDKTGMFWALCAAFLILATNISSASITLTPILDKTTGCLVYVDSDRMQCDPGEGAYGQRYEYTFTIPSTVSGNVIDAGSGWIKYQYCTELKFGYDAQPSLNGYSSFDNVPAKSVLDFSGTNTFGIKQVVFSNYPVVDKPYSIHGLKSLQLCLYSPQLLIELASKLPGQVKTGDKIEISGIVQNIGDIDAKGTTLKYVSKDFFADPQSYTVDVFNKDSGDSQKRFKFTLTPRIGAEGNYELNGIDFGQLVAEKDGRTVATLELGKRPYTQVKAPQTPQKPDVAPLPSISTPPVKTENPFPWALVALAAVGMWLLVAIAGAGYYFFVLKKKGKKK